MQVTVDLPDDVYATALSVAKRESRTVGSVIADFIRGRRSSLPLQPAKTPPPGNRFPVVEGRPVTQEEIDRLLEEDGLP